MIKKQVAVVVAALIFPGALMLGEADAGSTKVSAVHTEVSDVAAAQEWQSNNAAHFDRLADVFEGEPNFTAIRLRHDDEVVELIGAGVPTAAVQEVMNQAPPHVYPRWVPAQYTDQELSAAEDEVVTANTQAVEITQRDDFSGLVVVVESTGERLRIDRRRLKASTGVPVAIVSSPAGNSYEDGRADDEAPFGGGMRATIGCSTGFKVTRPDGTKMMLTARHCTGGNPGYLYNTAAGQNMGQSTDWAVYNFDVTGIRGRGYTLTSWLGPWVQPGQHEERIGGGARHYYLGEILIFSGSYSGQHSGQISKLRTRWRPNSTAP